jgi:hypothetical protein
MPDTFFTIKDTTEALSGILYKTEVCDLAGLG